jgi:uncharacterized protein (UPF0179 family)
MSHHCPLYTLTVHQEVEHLQAEILRLQERNKVAEQKAVEAEALKCELANVTSNAHRERRSAEEAACAQFSSLIQENSKLAARAGSLVHNFQEAENIIMVLTLSLELSNCSWYNVIKIPKFTLHG